MDLHVTLAGRDLSGQLYRQLRAAILDGRLRAGEPLPPTRELAGRLGVSRNTVSTAYARLGAEGFLSGRMGSGTYVGDVAPHARSTRRAPAGAGLRPSPFWSTVPPWERDARPAPYDFRVGVPDPRLFPFTTWRRLVARELEVARVRASSYGDPSGEPAVRETLARHLGVSRSVQAAADDVIVTSGAQQALDLVARVLVEAGTVVAVEEPGYPQARFIFASHGARVVPVAVDADGLVVEALPTSARLVYVTPSHQFPLGMVMSLPRRLALLDWAERHGAVVVEDDYDSEFRFAGRALEPLQCLDRRGRVIYVGSFSKVLLPALRLGYLVTPAALRDALRAAKLLADGYGPPAWQAAIARFIDDGGMARHIRKARREYQLRRERLERALAKEVGNRMTVIESVAGLHVSAMFAGVGKRTVDAAAVALRARAAGIAVNTVGEFSMAERPPAGLTLGFGSIAGDRIDEGIRRLAGVL